MKINMSFPATGCQKLLEITDELKVMMVLFYSMIIIYCDYFSTGIRVFHVFCYR